MLRDPEFTGDAALFAALFLAGYSAVMVDTARRVVGGETPDTVLADHGVRLERMFDVLRNGL